MILTIKSYMVKDIRFGSITSYSNQVLTIDKENIISKLNLNTKNYKVDFSIAKPNESKRIIHITDVVKPCWKTEGSTYAGWTKGENKTGYGVTHQLENMTVMQCCKFQGIQEGIVDMAGAGSKYSLFSTKINLIMVVDVINSNIDKKELAIDLNKMLLSVSEYIASLSINSLDYISNTFEIKPKSKNLPSIGYAYFIQAQGPLRNVYVYGEDYVEKKPRLMHPNEIKDGAVVSGNYIIACQKNPTYFHQDNPIINSLYEKDGKELNFSGVIISTESNMLENKKDNASEIAFISKREGIDGIIITQEGGGHADVDLMLTAEACEKVGINTVVIANEISGSNGDLPPLVSFSRVQDAIVTTGNNDEIITLDPVKEVVGGSDLLNGKTDPHDGFDTSLGIMYTATNQLGANKMTSIEF